jgi:hypothetical protein
MAVLSLRELHFKQTGKNMEEETITFKTAERMMYGVLDYEGNELMAAITGYDLDVSFNMCLIHSIADAESCANALADVFYQALMEKLLAKKKLSDNG